MDADQSVEPVDQEFEAFLARPSTLPDVTITLVGFASEQAANQLAEILRAHLSIFGRLMDLSGLAQVYVSYDYRNTLATLERGLEAGRLLAPTEDEIAVGIAMAAAVVRDGRVKSVIVLSAPHCASLLPTEEIPTEAQSLEELRHLVIHTVAHECGHVHDRELMARCFPDVLLKQKWSPGQDALAGTAFACWEEYIASRLSAPWGDEQTVRGFEDSFCSRLEHAWSTMLRSIRLYRMHRDVARVLTEVASQIRFVGMYGSYLLGHLAGSDQTLETAAPKAGALLELNPPFGRFMKRLERDCDALSSTHGSWTGMNVFDPLTEAVHDLYKEVGLTFSENQNGTHIDIPHRADTLPSSAEYLEFQQQQIQKQIADVMNRAETASPASKP
jgi:hypothetical protein